MDFQAQEDFQLEDRVDAGLTYGVASQAHAMNAEEGGNPYAGWTADELIAGMEGVRTQIGQLKKEVQAIRCRKNYKAKKAAKSPESEYNENQHEIVAALKPEMNADTETAGKDERIAELQARIQETQAELAAVLGDAKHQNTQKRKRISKKETERGAEGERRELRSLRSATRSKSN